MKYGVLVLAVVGLSQLVKGGSLLGADIQYAHVGSLTWSFTVITYVDPFGPADIPELLVTAGGEADTIPREFQSMIFGDCFMQISRDVYTWQHTFSGPGIYEVRAWKPGRKETLNLFVVPDNILCLSTEIVVSAELSNSSPVFGTPQRTSYYVGNQFVHDPMVTDPDGDSLAFYPHVPLGSDCSTLMGYSAPALVTPGGDYTVLNAATGLFQWAEPNTSGEFVVGIRCTEWRGGQMIGSVTRDMTVCLEAPFTSIEEPERNDPIILQSSFDGPVILQWKVVVGHMVDILDTRGALVEGVRLSGTRTTIATDGMAPGIYLLKMTDVKGMITTGRFVVSR